MNTYTTAIIYISGIPPKINTVTNSTYTITMKIQTAAIKVGDMNRSKKKN